MVANLPLEWSPCDFLLEESVALSSFRYEYFARWTPYAEEHGLLRVYHGGRWVYVYLDEGQGCFYRLGIDLHEVCTIVKRIMVHWALASKLPRASFVDKDIGAWLDACV